MSHFQWWWRVLTPSYPLTLYSRYSAVRNPALNSLLGPSSARRPGLGKRISIPTLHPNRKPLEEVQNKKRFVPVLKGKRKKAADALAAAALAKSERRARRKMREGETPEQRAERKRQEAEDGVFEVTSDEDDSEDEDSDDEAGGGEKKRQRLYSDCDTEEELERIKEDKKRMMEGLDEGYL